MGSDGRIYVFGGYVKVPESKIRQFGLGKYSLVIYDPKANRWSRGPEVPPYRSPVRDRRMNFPRGQVIREMKMPYEVPSAGSARGLVYWFNEALGPLVFDPRQGAWTEPTPPIRRQDERRWEGPMPLYERSAAATATGPDGKLYLIGGVGSRIGETRGSYRLDLLTSVDVYEPATNTWSTIPPMHQGRQLFAACFGPDGKLYVFGGFGHTGTITQRPGESNESFAKRNAEMDRLARHALDSVEAYDPKTNTWSPRAPMPLGVLGSGAALGADDRIYVVGGAVNFSNPKPVDRVQVYDPRTDSWSDGPSLHVARHGHVVVATSDGRIYAIGGTGVYSVFHPREIVGGSPKRKGSLLDSVEVLDTAPHRPAPEPKPAPPDRG